MPDPTVESVPQTNSPSEPLVVVDPEVHQPPRGDYWVHDDMIPLDDKDEPYPAFSVMEVAKTFFGKSPDWLRLRMRGDTKYVRDDKGQRQQVVGRFPQGYFILDGQPLDFRRTDSGARYFLLSDVERMAHALAQNRQIDGATLNNIITIVKTVARQWGIL